MPSYSKSTSFDNFDKKNLSNYFSGVVAYENRNNSDALKFFNASKILLYNHDPYLKRYVYSLVLDNKVAQAIKIINSSKKKNDVNFFDSHLLLIVDSFKKNNFKKAEQQLTQILKLQNQSRINFVIFETLKGYIYTFRNKKILTEEKKFGNISIINQAFQRCYLKQDSTESYFLNLINNAESDYSRYIFFYLNYLIENKKFKEAEIVSKEFKYINSTLLVSQGKSWIENKKFKEFNKVFSCNNHNDIIGEFLFLLSNLYSTESNFEKSNFYLNLSNYLNPKFKFNFTLVAENFYLNKEYNKAKKILKKFNKNDDFYYWFRSKKEAQIIIKQRNDKEGINFINSKFNKIEKPNLKIILDMANFHKNAEKYNQSIDYYTKILDALDDTDELKSDLLYRRGASYERLGNYKKADKDLLHALSINPDDAYVLNYLAYSWLERDYQIDKAIEMLEKAYSSRSNDPYIIDSIGWAYYLINNYIKAEKYLRRAVELMPEDPIVNDHYGDILWKLDQKIQARYFWSNVLTLNDTEDDMKKKIKTKMVKGVKSSQNAF